MDILEKVIAFINSYPIYARVLMASSLLLFLGTALIIPRKAPGRAIPSAEKGFGVSIQKEGAGPKLKAAAVMNEQDFISYFKDRGFREASHKLWFDLIVTPLRFDIAIGFSDIPNAPDYLYLIDVLDHRQVSISTLSERWEAVSKLLMSEKAKKQIGGRFGGKPYQHIVYAQVVGKREQLPQDLIQEIRKINQEPPAREGRRVLFRRAYTAELLIQGLKL